MTFKTHYNNTKDFIVVYPGRFEPFSGQHFEIYLYLVSKFTANRVYITTTNKVELPNSPFNFTEKKLIMTRMFEISGDHIVEVVSPYRSTELFEKLPNKDVGAIYVLGAKDADRLKLGKYFTTYKDGQKEFESYKTRGYVLVIPDGLNKIKFDGNLISGTLIRGVFTGSDEGKKERLFKIIYPKNDKYVWKLLNDKLGTKQ